MTLHETLLELERLDREADAARERRASLPELAELEACRAAQQALGSEREATRARRLPVEAEVRRLEAEVETLAARAQKLEDDLYSGRITVARELEDLQGELQGCRGRQAEFEEETLGAMEQLEAVDAELAGLDDRERELALEAERLDAAIAKARGEIDAELEGLAKARAGVVPGLPAPWIATYDRVRTQKRLKGHVVARFDDGRCDGCRVALPVMDVSRIHREPADAVIQCPRCTRMLLRGAPAAG